MKLKDWVDQELEKALPNGFDWDMVVEDDSDIQVAEWEPTGNFFYLVVEDDDNDVYLTSFDNILKAKDFVKDRILDGDCMANGGRGGPKFTNSLVILDLVERKVINVERKVLVEYVEEQ